MGDRGRLKECCTLFLLAEASNPIPKKGARTGIINGASWEGNGTAAFPVTQTGAEVLHPPCRGRCLVVNYHYSKPREMTQRAAASFLGTDRSSGFPLRDCINLRSKPRKEMQSVPSSDLNWQRILQPLHVRRLWCLIFHWLKPRMKAKMVPYIFFRLEWSFSYCVGAQLLTTRIWRWGSTGDACGYSLPRGSREVEKTIQGTYDFGNDFSMPNTIASKTEYIQAVLIHIKL